MLTEWQETAKLTLRELLRSFGPVATYDGVGPSTTWTVSALTHGVKLEIMSLNDNAEVSTHLVIKWTDFPEPGLETTRFCIAKVQQLLSQWWFYYKAMNVARMEMEQQP